MILEAWAPDFSGCCEGAVIALLALCIDGSGAEVTDRHTLNLPLATQESMLLDLLEEVIFVLDTVGTVPVGAEAHLQSDGAILVDLALADRETVEAIGSAPKGVSRSGLQVETEPDLIRCAFLIDV